MIVVDNNVLTYLWLPGKNKSLAARVAQKTLNGVYRFYGKVNLKVS